jgi:hypothetical protein
MRTIGATTELAFLDAGLVSSRLQLIATASGYHGVLDGEPMELNAEGSRISGSVGQSPINLHVDTRGRGIRLNGLFAGQVGRMILGPGIIISSIGGCSYRLHAVGDRYEGTRACGTLQPARVDLPLGFEHLPDERRAMLLFLLLAT